MQRGEYCGCDTRILRSRRWEVPRHFHGAVLCLPAQRGAALYLSYWSGSELVTRRDLQLGETSTLGQACVRATYSSVNLTDLSEHPEARSLTLATDRYRILLGKRARKSSWCVCLRVRLGSEWRETKQPGCRPNNPASFLCQ